MEEIKVYKNTIHRSCIISTYTRSLYGDLSNRSVIHTHTYVHMKPCTHIYEILLVFGSG